ncbi:MAG: tetratricopeptide repeat protein [Nitrospiraceae bacterium]|nr:MAG: tetratricopeptide repeat protein [Nitrospiraceae bacterium]
MKQHACIKIAVLFLLPLFVSCAINPVTGRHELMLVSEAQELNLGKEEAPSLTWEFGGHYKDSALEPYLESIVRKIWQNSERPQLPMKFYVQNTSLPNAFALPGYVAITRGLLSSLENEAQFAAVMGHEVGHVMARHTAQRLSRMTLQQLGLAIGSATLQGIGGGDALLQVGALGSSLLLLKYDRSQEIQSDRLGVKYMADLGYNPYEAMSAHDVLQKAVDDYLKRMGKSRSEDSAISQLFSTHPRHEVRLNEIQSMINELPPYRMQNDGIFRKQFQDATERIRRINKIYYIYDEAEMHYQKKDFRTAEEKVKKAISLDDSQPSFHNLLGMTKLQLKNYTEAENAFRSALSIDSGYQPAHYGLGLARYFQENYREAVAEFKKSLALYPDHVQTHFGLGQSYFQMRQYAEAIPYLRNFAQAAPKHPDIHGLLGICYEKVGEVRPAIVEYENQLKVSPDSEMGRHARKRLAVLAPMIK